MKFYSHLNSAKQLIAEYKGQQPFAVFLRAFFKQHKKYGSKDRKDIAGMCFAFFRLGKALSFLPLEEKIVAGLFVCSTEKNDALNFLRPEWVSFFERPGFPTLEERVSFIRSVYESFSEEQIFPFADELEESVDKKPFTYAHLRQPDLFIRIRTAHEKILRAIEALNTPHEFIEPSTVRLPNSFSVESVATVDKEAVIQDYSSQRTGAMMQMIDRDRRFPLQVWDCCAASGGKSIMAFDLLRDIQLTVSDVRKSILENLGKRFSAAGIKNYRSFVLDLSAGIPGRHQMRLPDDDSSGFDLIIVDAPCTGSGTWSRNPEQLSFFKLSEIERYASLQKTIVTHALPFLKKNGYLLYITCSVFKKENTDVVDHLVENTGLVIIEKQLMRGYDKKADTLFAALFSLR